VRLKLLAPLAPMPSAIGTRNLEEVAKQQAEPVAAPSSILISVLALMDSRPLAHRVLLGPVSRPIACGADLVRSLDIAPHPPSIALAVISAADLALLSVFHPMRLLWLVDSLRGSSF